MFESVTQKLVFEIVDRRKVTDGTSKDYYDFVLEALFQAFPEESKYVINKNKEILDGIMSNRLRRLSKE